LGARGAVEYRGLTKRRRKMEEIELWCGIRGNTFRSTHLVCFTGEFLGVVDVARVDDWVERCVLYRTEDGRVVVHQMRLSLLDDSVDVAEVYTLPALDAGEGEGGVLCER
jgi:hypothetical protein